MHKKSLLTAIPALGLAIAGCTTLPDLPENLAPAPGAKLAKIVPAKGVQVYECRAKAGATEWAFVAPDAELYDIRGHRIGTHGAGPFWAAGDGSRVVAKVHARADSPAGAIPWLLLNASSTGKEGSFSAVTQIQRVNTVGGNAPSLPCKAGDTARVPYTADYRFFASR
jgi:hypothetical protein